MRNDGASLASHNTYVLVTGANSGLGLATCCRLIDEFLNSHSTDHRLTLIFTTRSDKKASATLATLKKHLSRHPAIRPRLPLLNSQILFRPENLDLSSLLSVKALSQRLLRSAIPRLDAIILNAGVGGFVGFDLPLGLWYVVTDLVEGTTWPSFKLSATGLITQSQLPISAADPGDEEPVLGEVFCANIFGHYMLVHWLMPLLRACPRSRPGRIIWTSSLESQVHHFDRGDFQALESRNAYEHTKRMTDLMAITSTNQHATAESLQSFLKPSTNDRRLHDNPAPSEPTIHVAHPGVCATSIMPISWVLSQLLVLVLFIARFIGSPWHTVSAYSGASAPVWLALADPDEIAEREKGGFPKWGSAVTRWGTERVERTDVPQWGVRGDGRQVEWWHVGPGWRGGWGRKRGAKDATREDVEKFVEDGAFVWRELERLRTEWEARIERFENSDKKAEHEAPGGTTSDLNPQTREWDLHPELRPAVIHTMQHQL